MMDDNEKFELIIAIGKIIVSEYSSFSLNEKLFCQNAANWMPVRDVVMASNHYEALISMELNPTFSIINFFQMLIGCMIQFQEETTNDRLENLLQIIDNHDQLDRLITNTKIIRSLLVLNSSFQKKNKLCNFGIFLNAKRILAHVFKKFPDFLKMNVIRTKGKLRKQKFTQEDISAFW